MQATTKSKERFCVSQFSKLFSTSVLPQLLGVLAQDGVLRWLDMESYQLLTQTGSHDLAISHAHSSPDGHYLAAVSESGSVLIYEISLILRKMNQVRQPASIILSIK